MRRLDSGSEGRLRRDARALVGNAVCAVRSARTSQELQALSAYERGRRSREFRRGVRVRQQRCGRCGARSFARVWLASVKMKGPARHPGRDRKVERGSPEAGGATSIDPPPRRLRALRCARGPGPHAVSQPPSRLLSRHSPAHPAQSPACPSAACRHTPGVRAPSQVGSASFARPHSWLATLAVHRCTSVGRSPGLRGWLISVRPVRAGATRLLAGWRRSRRL